MSFNRRNINNSTPKYRVKSKGLRLNWTSIKDLKEVRLSDVLGEGEVDEIKTSVKPLLVP